MLSSSTDNFVPGVGFETHKPLRAMVFETIAFA